LDPGLSPLHHNLHFHFPFKCPSFFLCLPGAFHEIYSKNSLCFPLCTTHITHCATCDLNTLNIIKRRSCMCECAHTITVVCCIILPIPCLISSVSKYFPCYIQKENNEQYNSVTVIIIV
jgi:hypothetical protein